ncbi:c-type cytochrome [Aestuariispira insulae]|uniref:Cytochrome c556 n=1 Tax=Aestuariispira insulae TaxID=1461337 RepID=A0A3D9HQ42_9PROT|nr:cytochrome c [Aestuariispira insulae]RED51608.1 cytochrome c556 [Aestuariispira insulae]
MISFSRIAAPLLTVTMLVSGLAVQAHEGATGVVKERMEAMEDVGKSMKALKAMITGEITYDADKVRMAAKTIAGHGGDNLTRLFPEGSTQHPTAALPAIWEDWQGFSRLAADLASHADALAKAAGNDRSMAESSMGGDMMSAAPAAPTPAELAGMAPDSAFMALGKVCGSCHKQFRKKKE